MEATKNDKLDLMLHMVAAECCKADVEEFDSIDDSEVEFSEDFYKKRDRIIRKYKYRPFLRSVRKVASRAAIVLMAIMSAAFITVMAAEPLREALFEAVVEWYDDYLTIRYEKTDETEESTESVTEGKTENSIANGTTNESTNESETIVNEAVPSETIEEVRKPTSLPDGVVEDVVLQNSAGVCIDYYLNNDSIFTFNQMLLKDRDKYLDNETAVIDTVDINGNEATIVEYDDKIGVAIVWTDGEYVYQIYSEKSNLDKLVPIAVSVK